MNPEFNKIAIFGVGLIGGSIGLTIKSKCDLHPPMLKLRWTRKSKIKLIGIGRNIERLKIAKRFNAVDEITTDYAVGVKDADLIIICTPVETIVPLTKKILPYVKKSAIITDVGSIKYPIIKEMKTILKKYQVNFVGSHPIAGSEKSGIEFATSQMFNESVCVLCYDPKLSSYNAYKKVKHFWTFLGAKIVELTPKQHDKILAATSHFLHIIAYVLSKQINSRKKYLNFVGGAYRDMTRIAKSTPELWSAICYMNRSEIKKEIKKFVAELKLLEKFITDYDKLKNYLYNCYNLKMKQ